MTKQTVTALVTCYNKADFIVACVKALVECIEIDNVIVYDDASTDASLTLLQKSFAQNDKVEILNGTINRGVAFARNHLLSIAKGDIILFVDGDDIVDSGTKDLQIRNFRCNLDKCFSYSDYERKSDFYTKHIKSGDYSYNRLKTHNFIPFSSVIIRGDLGMTFETVHHEDYIMWLLYLKGNHPHVVDYYEESTFVYNETNDSLSSSIWKGLLSNYKIKRRTGMGLMEAIGRTFLYIIIVGLKRWT